MRRLGLSRYALSVCAAGLLVSACGGSQPPIAVPGTVPQTRGPDASSFSAGRSFRRLFSFNGRDGAEPRGLTAFGGRLYGVTSGGGRNGAGTFFSLTTSGERHTLYSFSDRNGDGTPMSVLTPLNGLLYGWTRSVTRSGPCANQSSICGVIFSLTTSGQERTVHEFRMHHRKPFFLTSLTVLNDELYGTTENGSLGRDGTVFSLTPAGDFHVLYRFRGRLGASKDGNFPNSIVALNGMLYGTTEYGGATGNGTIFSITPAGEEHVLYSFQDGHQGVSDGAVPNGVIVFHGKLYGTTFFGGDYYYCDGDPPAGCGTFFSVTTAGEEQVLYSFQPGRDGNPNSDLAVLNGKLYGTTYDGVLYSLTTAGTEKALHTLNGCGCSPELTPTPLKGALYGTTFGGGKHHSGTAYVFVP